MDLIKVDPFVNVAAGQRATATWRPPSPMSLHGFVLRLGGTFDETDIDSIKVKKGGKELVPGISGPNHRDLYEYEGLIYDAASIPIMFGDPAARTFRGKHLGNFDHTVYPGDMTIEVDIDATPTTPTLEAYALVMPPKLAMGAGYSAEEAALHRAYVETILQTSAGVTLKAFDVGVGSGAGALLKRLYFLHGGDMTHLNIKRRGIDIWENVAQAVVDYLQDDLYTRAPQANTYVYDAILDGDYSEVKTTVDQNGQPINYQVAITTSGAATIVTYADILTRLTLL
jgi:hypothetical protein